MARRPTERLWAAAAALLLAAAPAGATTYYVAPTGSDKNAGTSAAPFLTLQAGVDHVSAGDTIIVRDGTYGPTGPAGSMGVTITKSGSSGAWITLEAEHNGAAILDCQLVCHSYIDLGSGSGYWIIKGFDIRNGYWGGIFANNMSAGYVQIRDNVIHNIGNRSDSSGIGIMGIYTDSGANHWTIDGNVFHDIGRTSVLTGTHDHGIYTHGSSFSITNNVFYDLKNGWHIQTAAGFSGAIANNTFYGPDPVAGTVGQLMLWGAHSSLTIRNNIFYGASSVGITTYALAVSAPCTIDHNLAYTPGGTVSVIGGTPSNCTQTSEKLNVDPKLANPSGHDFHLASGSPAIDAGTAVQGLTADFAGSPRPQGSAFDVGAYEYGGSGATTVTAPPGCAIATPPAWVNMSVPQQTGSFTLTFAATPSQAKMDGVMGLANGPATAYSSLAALVRFNNAGTIDARNGGAYAAAATIPYSAGVTYHFRLLVSIAAHAYSAYVKAGSGTEALIGANYKFRTEQASVTALSSLGLEASTGNESICTPAVAASVPPTISGVAVSNTTASQAVVSWTTNVPADSEVDYGTTASYGLTAPTNAALSTSHSVTVSGLSAATTYHYRAKSRDASGNVVTSSDATFTTAPAASATGGTCVTAPAGAWKNEALPPQVGTFTVAFDAKPGAAGMDGVIGLSNGAATGYASLAAAVRFNSTGKIDARNGGAYAAAVSLGYSAGSTYRFRLVVNAASHIYSVYVTPPGSSERLLGLNYAFRTEQAKTSTLSNLGLLATTGSQTLCSLSSAGAAVPIK